MRLARSELNTPRRAEKMRDADQAQALLEKATRQLIRRAARG